MTPQAFWEEFSAKFDGKRIPFSGQMELTSRCNVRCSHCYIRDNGSSGEITLPEIRRFIDEMADEGCLWLTLSGGEPLLRPDFLDIYTYGKKKGLMVSVFTNGTLLDESVADCFGELPPYGVEISLYGATQETYEKIVGVSGSYRRCMRAIDLLLKRGIRTRLKTVAITLNQHELEDIRRLTEGWGLPFRYDPVINPRIDGGMGPCALRIPPEEVVALDLADQGRAEAFRKGLPRLFGRRLSTYLFDCGAARGGFHIDAHGRLQPCVVARRFSYDLRGGSFKEGWHNYFSHVLALKRQEPSRCDQCDLSGGVCDMCQAWTELDRSADDGPVDYICEIAHLRANAFACNAPGGVGGIG